ncbi:MAG: GNAT family N-acetyltransferase [Promethearchaeia archaeon]
MSQKNFEANLSFLKKYKKKEMFAEAAIRKYIKPGDRIYIDSICAEPTVLTRKLIEIGEDLPDVQIQHLLSLSDLDYYRDMSRVEKLFRHNSFFIGENLRDAINKGKADYTPMLLSRIPQLFQRGKIHLDTVMIQVSPPSKYGYCSFGTNVSIVKPLAESADHVIAEINPKMPCTFGDSFIHMGKIDAYTLVDHDLLEFSYEDPGKTAKKISKYVASLIEDDSTIQMGIGQIPNAVTHELVDKKDLGVHSEVFSDGIVDLVDEGVITCRKKTLHKDKIISSFVMGSKKLFDFINLNPMVEFHPVDYVNDPYIISKNKKQVAINAALSVDLTGQVNSDSIGHKFYSGIGGQVDFVRGAARAEGGKPIMVLPSTAELDDGTLVSRIVPYLQPGSGVVITRGDVHYVVTEWGIADLNGKSIRERVLQLINVAHPDFREELLECAKKWNYVYPDQQLPKSVEGRISVYPEEYETTLELPNGKEILIRPIKPTDERLVQELFYSLGDQERYFRFFKTIKSFRHDRVQPLITIDYSTSMILVGETMKEKEKKIIAQAAFVKSDQPSVGELSFIVHKDWRGLGITKYMLDYLIQIGRELGYKEFSGTILLNNEAMLHIINSAPYPMTLKRYANGIFEFRMDITTRKKKER